MKSKTSTLKTLGRLAALAVATGMLVTGNPAQAVETRHKINATAVGAYTGPTTSASQIIGGGILHGTTTADLAITGFDPETGVATFVGTLVLTTRKGTLTLDFLDGVFNLVTGEFSTNSVVTGGTGRFDGATGELYFHGFSYSDGTFIDDEISGVIYVNRP